MNKAELITASAHRSRFWTKDTELIINTMLEIIVERLHAGESVSLPGFGTFSVHERAARTINSPIIGKPVDVPARKIVKFITGSKLKL